MKNLCGNHIDGQGSQEGALGRAEEQQWLVLGGGKDFENPLCSQLNCITLSYVALFQKRGAVCVGEGAEILCPETQPGTLLTQDLNFSVSQN